MVPRTRTLVWACAAETSTIPANTPMTRRSFIVFSMDDGAACERRCSSLGWCRMLTADRDRSFRCGDAQRAAGILLSVTRAKTLLLGLYSSIETDASPALDKRSEDICRATYKGIIRLQMKLHALVGGTSSSVLL